MRGQQDLLSACIYTEKVQNARIRRQLLCKYEVLRLKGPNMVRKWLMGLVGSFGGSNFAFPTGFEPVFPVSRENGA